MKQENIKKIMEQIRSKKNNETNELVVAAEEVSLLNTTNEVSGASDTPDFSNEYVSMTGLGINEFGDVILPGSPFVGTLYDYTLVTQVEFNIAALCYSRGVSKSSIRVV